MTATMTEKQRQAVAAREAARSQDCSLIAYSGDREQRFHAMVNVAWCRRLEGWFLR